MLPIYIYPVFVQVSAGYFVSSCLALLLLEIYGSSFSQGGEVFTVPFGEEFSFSLRVEVILDDS